MPAIRLSDRLGADVDVDLAPLSALLRYLRQIPSLFVEGANLSQIRGLTLDDPAIGGFKTGLVFAEPVDALADAGAVIRVGAGGSFQLFAPAPLWENLFPGDSLGEAVRIPADATYVRTALEAGVGATAGTAVGRLRFGGGPSTKIEFASYRLIVPSKGVTLLAALADGVGNFLIPASVDDLRAMAVDAIATVRIEGALRLSASADLLALTNPLAAAALPGPIPDFALSAGGSVRIGASVSIGGRFELRTRKLENGRVRLGWYKEKNTEVRVQASAGAGVNAGMGDTDLLSTILRVVSGNPRASSRELLDAGLPEQQVRDIQAAVSGAVSRRVEVSVAAQMTSLRSDEAAFLYEIDPEAVDAASRDAIEAALRGDLSGLEAGDLAGVVCLRTVWREIRARRVTLRVNLLGIFNYTSVMSLIRKGTVLYEPDTGEMVITDEVNASRVRSAQVNFGADTQKLRRVLAESFLITAVYRGSALAPGGPALRCSHSFFELRNDTSRADMRRTLRAAAALGLAPPSEPEAPEAGFGRTIVSIQTEYSDSVAASLFLDSGGKPHPRDLYESTGRAAIQMLVDENGLDAARRRPAIDDDLWREMKRKGQANFTPLFPGVPAPVLGAIIADYSTIVWWADAMSGAATRLAAVRRLAGTPLEAAEFQAARKDLGDYLEKVAARTTEEFGQPWGLVAMYEASNRAAQASILIAGPLFALSKSSELARTADA